MIFGELSWQRNATTFSRRHRGFYDLQWLEDGIISLYNSTVSAQLKLWGLRITFRIFHFLFLGDWQEGRRGDRVLRVRYCGAILSRRLCDQYTKEGRKKWNTHTRSGVGSIHSWEEHSILLLSRVQMTKAYARGKTRLQQPIRARVFGFLALLRSPKSKDDPPVIKHANKRTDDATRAPPAQATRLGTKERMKKKRGGGGGLGGGLY
jgi:hypothetical protein